MFLKKFKPFYLLLKKITMNNPTISVIMPNYNGEKYIAEAIESILNQTFSDFEFIIVDDASTDKSWEIIEEYTEKDIRIIALRNKQNSWICKTLNIGLEQAKGKYIARMDSDDISLPERFEKQYNFLEAHNDTILVWGASIYIDGKGEKFGERKVETESENIDRQINFANPIVHAASFFRKNTFRYFHHYRMVEDYHMWYQLRSLGKLANIAEPLILYRRHWDNITMQFSQQLKSKYLQFIVVLLYWKNIKNGKYFRAVLYKFLCLFIREKYLTFLLPS